MDATRTLWIDYTDRTLQTRDLPFYTRTMVRNACINRWYHRQGRSAYPGYRVADQALSDFEEGSALLDNGGPGFGFGVRRINQGTKPSWIAFTPISMTDDGQNFLWCVFDPGTGNPRVLYHAAGTVAELLAPLAGSNDIWAFSSAEGVTDPQAELGIYHGMMRVMDMVTADTALNNVSSRIKSMQEAEGNLAAQAK